MAYVSIPKDLSKVKPKVLLNLTKRQLICFSLGLVTGLPLFFLLRGSLGGGTAALVMILVMLPFFLTGLYERNGMGLEKIIGNVINVKFRRAGVRVYRTRNIYRYLMNDTNIRNTDERS